jgi:putative transferase (TIGR04331 family)
VKRFLVTTALEKTWPADDIPMLFLGEWCRLYEKKSVWEKYDTAVTPYHWDDREKLHKDYLYLQTLYEELLSELATKLNTLHGVNYSVRYWRIITGPWLGYFVQMLFDRWAMLRQVERENNISGVRVLQRTDECFVANDMGDFIALFFGDAWNETIYGQLLEWMDIPVEKIDAGREVPVSSVRESNKSFSRRTRSALVKVASRIAGLFCRDNEYFFISSYLPIKQDLLLQLKLGQVPKLWRAVAPPVTPVNYSMRQWQMPKPLNADDFPAIVRAMIPRHIPKVYLEGYRAALAVSENLPWPKCPQVIFTSNSFSADDIFKIWAAKKIENGSLLVIGQHGGNYGMARWGFTEDHQIAICDRFLTWGWRQQGQKKITPVGNLKSFGKQGIWDKDGVALLVEMAVPRASYHMYSIPVAGQWLDYFEDQCRFVQALPEELRDQVIVRLYSQDYDWSQKQRWQERFAKIQLDEGAGPMASLVKKSRLYISTYNATTYLESMSLNIPTVMFWDPKHWELRDSATPFFEKLKAVGIFHESPEDAARHVASVWDDISGWWESAAVQSVRTEFCDHYASISEKPLETMEKLFREIADTNESG